MALAGPVAAIIGYLLGECYAYAQFPYSGTTWSLTSASSSLTNYPATLPGAEHFWLSSDLAINTNLGITGPWTDRVAAVSWYPEAANRKPTNASIGLVFSGTHALTNSQTASIGAGSSMSTDDTVHFRMFCVAYATTNGINMGMLGDVLAGSVGANMNATGGSGNQAGNVNYQTTASDHIVCTGLKTDGTLQDYCFSQTNSGTTFGIEGYTNGVLCIQLAPASGIVREPMMSLGEGFNLGKFSLQAIAVYTNVNRVSTASNWHYWCTNIFNRPPP